ncbi:MAG: putative ribosome quality control (RQC) complex YloA/Tae2 family protein [Halobacteriales archaeon]|jgi:predicted ribosome quality control (RQC) complex YloA/Tae2 family protein
MEPKREPSSVDLAALVGELGAYEGAKLDKAYLYGDDLVRLKLRDYDRGRVELLCEVGDVKRVHAAAPEHVPDAPGRPPDFAMMLRNRLSGADLVDVSQYEFDRIVEFTFEREDGTTSIVVELFGDGNVAVLDGDRKVIDSLDTVRLKSRTVAPGSTYEFPESRVNPLAVDYDTFAALMDESDTDLVRTLATQLNLGGLWGEELCSRAGVEKTMPIEDAGDDEYERLFDALDRLSAALQSADLDPRVYREDDRVVDVAPVRLEERERAGLVAEPYDTFNDGLDAYFHELEREEDEPGEEGPDFEAEIAKRKRIIDQQEGAIEDFEAQAEAERERAELLYANYDLADEILSTIQAAREDDVPWDDIAARFEEGQDRGIPEAEAVVDVDGENGTVTVAIDDERIELEADTGVEKNADRLYQEAKRVEEKKEGALEAIEDTREELEELKRQREEWASRDEAAGSDAEGEDEEDDGRRPDEEWLSTTSIPVRRDEKWYERFRWFHTSDGFLVIGGRDADDNEEIVKKYLDRGDRFFHTQAEGGPATVLKASGPSEAAPEDPDIPEGSKDEAARFAVSYSSVWKDGKFAGDVYEVAYDQVSKTPESGEFLEKGGFAIRGDRTYYDDTAVGVAVGITCEPETRVIGGPPSAIEDRAVTSVRVEPGRFAQADVGKRIYRVFRERFADTSFVRKVASPDRIQHFLPPGGSRIADGE